VAQTRHLEQFPGHDARWSRSVRWSGSPALPLVLGVVCGLAVVRFLVTAFSYGHPAWFDEELNPLITFVRQGQPVASIDQRQYGVVVFLVFEPAVRLFGSNGDALANYALAVALPCVVGAFALMAHRYARQSVSRVLLLAIVWFSSVPLLYVIAQRIVDAWQLFFLSLALFLFTGSSRLRGLAGLPLAAAALTKLLPALLLVYLLVRCWRAGLVGLAGVAALLGIGQLVYGPLLGFGYPLSVLATGGEAVRRWSTHFENNSLRGLLYKAAAGFRLDGDSTAYALPADWLPVLNLVAYALAASLVAYLLLVAWRSRGRHGLARRSIEFSLAIVTMLLVSPHTAQDYTVAMLPVFGVGLYLTLRGEPVRWSPGLVVLGCTAAVLVGVFLPMNVMGRVLLLGPLLELTHNAQNPLFGDQAGGGIGVYDFFGFPGLGLVLAWVVLVRLERLTASEHTFQGVAARPLLPWRLDAEHAAEP
jgi:Glycosyltransferase family 87